MKAKKLISMLIVVLMLVAGCTSKQVEPENASASKENQGKDVIEITYWHSMDGVYGELLNRQIDTFNSTIGAEKGIKVTGVFQNWPGTESLTAAMSTDDIENMPDVIQLYGESVSLIRDYERTVWADDHITSENSLVKKEDLIANAVSSHSIDGKMIGVPYTVSALMLYYNETYLKEAGFDAPPATIDEMAKMMPEIVAKTDAENGLNVRINQYELENFIATQGVNGTYFGNNESGHKDYMTELAADKNGSLMNFLTEWEKVVKTGVYKETRDSINEEFANGLHAMVIMTSSRIKTINELVGDKFEWSIAPIPKVNADDVGGAYPSGSGLYMLNRDDDAKVNAAWEFVSYMISPEAQAMWLDGTGYTPVNVNTVELEEFQTTLKNEPRLQIPMDTLMNSPKSIVPAFAPNWSTINGVIKDTMMSFGSGAISKDEAYAAIVDGITKAIKEYYRANPID